MFQSTHSLRSATDVADIHRFLRDVSIHALLAECDGGNPGNNRNTNKFQSTHSLRSATVAAVWSILPTGVSIHALLAECDSAKSHLPPLP